MVGLGQARGIKGFLPTSVIQGNPPLYEQNRPWESLSVVSQKWSFPTALDWDVHWGYDLDFDAWPNLSP